MENFSLNDVNCRVGDQLLDAQHQVVLGYMARIYRLLLAGEKGKDLSELVDRLDTFCKMHFWDEEKTMEAMGYPVIEDHQFEHALFLKHLEEFTGRYEELDRVKGVDELLFLKGWFIEHILSFDKRYAEFGMKPRQGGVH